MYIQLYRVITNRNYCIVHGALINVMCQPGLKGGLRDTCMYMAESFHCSSETITTLLIGYTPIQNVFGAKNIKIQFKKIKKKKKLSGINKSSW